MQNVVRLAVFFFLAHSLAVADLDPVRGASQFIHHRLFDRCDHRKCNPSAAQKNTGDISKTLTKSLRAEFFSEMAKYEEEQAQCDFSFLSEFDLWGKNDYATACDRAKAQGPGRDFYFIAKGAPPKNERVSGLQRQILEDTAKRIEAIREVRAEIQRLPIADCPEANSGLPTNDPLTVCPEYQDKIRELQKQEELILSSTWNASSPEMRSYVLEHADSKSFSKDQFVASGLNAKSSLSFQRRVIEPAKDRACTDLQELRTIEKKPETLDDKAGENGRPRKYKKQLTAVGINRMETDPQFKQKYGALRCDLEVDYGPPSEKIETAIEVGVGLAAMAVPYLGEARLAALIGSRAASVVGTALFLTTQSANAFVNIHKACFSGSPVKTARQNICEKQSNPNYPLAAKLEEEIKSGDCALGLALEAAGAYGAAKRFADSKLVKEVTGETRLGLPPKSLTTSGEQSAASSGEQLAARVGREAQTAKTTPQLDPKRFTNLEKAWSENHPGVPIRLDDKTKAHIIEGHVLPEDIPDIHSPEFLRHPEVIARKRETVFPIGTKYEELVDELKKAKPTALQRATDATQSDKFQAEVFLRGEKVRVQYYVCAKPICKVKGETLREGEIVSLWPICGPNVFTIRTKENVVSELITKPCPP